MSNLFSAIEGNTYTRTWNGMKALVGSGDPLVDLFYKFGAARGKFDTVAPLVTAAVESEKDLAIRLLLWGRDARSGAGERQLFRDAVDLIASGEVLTMDEARRIIAKIPEIGRWDDLSVFVGTSLEDEALRFWVSQIVGGNGLAAKWAPRKGDLANRLRRVMEVSPREYRKTVVAATNVVETQMCAKQWNEIDFSKVPSVAAARYQKAFNRNAPEAYTEYKRRLVSIAPEDAKVKINAKAVYPYDVIKSLDNGDSVVADEQWKALPNYMEGSKTRGILPVVDTSGSMTCRAGGYGSNSNVTCMDVAVSLGLYLSERNEGFFKDQFITFSQNPQLQRVTGSLSQRHVQMKSSDWGFNTDLIRVFNTVLNAAVRSNLPESDMPEMILIISDMQFDTAVSSGRDATALETIRSKYARAGYEVPNIVFWNVNSSGNGVPTVANESRAALISGFSPSIMKSILRAEEITPRAIMLKTLMDPRYDW